MLVSEIKGADVRHITIVGSLAYLGGASSTSVVDISVPAAPRLLWSFANGSTIADIQCSGAYLSSVLGGTPNSLGTYQPYNLVDSVTQLSPLTYRIHLSTPLTGPFALQVAR